jgi:hypothetical protein
MLDIACSSRKGGSARATAHGLRGFEEIGFARSPAGIARLRSAPVAQQRVPAGAAYGVALRGRSEIFDLLTASQREFRTFREDSIFR